MASKHDNDPPGGMTGYASVFDERVERNRQRLFETGAGTLARDPAKPSAPVPSGFQGRTPALVFPMGAPAAFPPPAPATSPLAGTSAEAMEPVRTGQTVGSEAVGSEGVGSEAVRQLNERFGDGWTHEITERKREGDEVIVLCQVTIADQNISKTQFGRARVRPPGEANLLRGSADGVPIAFATGDSGDSHAIGAEDPEEAAFRQAVENALAKCVDLL